MIAVTCEYDISAWDSVTKIPCGAPASFIVKDKACLVPIPSFGTCEEHAEHYQDTPTWNSGWTVTLIDTDGTHPAPSVGRDQAEPTWSH